MKNSFSNDTMSKMAMANVLLFKKMYELGCQQQLNALEKAQESLVSSQKDFSQSMSEAMNSGDGTSLAKLMASMPLWAMRTQMLQGQKAMELNSHAFEEFGQPIREAFAEWQKQLGMAVPAEERSLTVRGTDGASAP